MFVHTTALLAVIRLSILVIILQVFTVMFTTFMFEVSPLQLHIFYITLLLIIYMPLHEIRNINESYIRREMFWQKKTSDIEEFNAPDAAPT